MSRNLIHPSEPAFTQADVDYYLENPGLKPPAMHDRPRFSAAVQLARIKARHTADALSRNPKYAQLQAEYADAVKAAGAALDRQKRMAELKAAQAEALEREARLKVEGKGIEAHEAHMEAHRARREVDALELEDFRTSGTDADPYRPLQTLEALRGKMEAAAAEVKAPLFAMPSGMEWRSAAFEEAKRKTRIIRG